MRLPIGKYIWQRGAIACLGLCHEVCPFPMRKLLTCRYMLYDQFDSSDVSLAVNDRQNLDISLHVQTADAAIDPVSCESGTYDGATGGSCTAVVPASLFLPAQTVESVVTLRVSRQGVVLAEASGSTVLVGALEQRSARARSASIVGPCRFIYPGEVVTFPVFANTSGEEAKAFSVSVQYDTAVFELVNEFEAGPGWQVRTRLSGSLDD